MYNEYFGLKDSPFSIAPNPQYLYMSQRHREALAHLVYGIKSDGGFILLTGEVGTGKTTICRCLLAQVPEDVDTAFVLNPKLTADELLATVCDDLGIACPEGASIKVLVDKLNEFLLASYQSGRRTVLIIDEAQNLSIDVLEQLRLLTNLETNQRKLLQIILLGQPELLDLLDKKELRQLSQRVTARFHLDALNREEVTAYIRHRIEVAGGHHALFNAGAISRIWKLSGGVPRLVNLVCDRSLLGAYATDRQVVDRRIVDKAAAEIFGQRREPPRRVGMPGLAVAAAAAIVILAGAAYLVQSGQRSWPLPSLTETHQAPGDVAATMPTVAAAPSTNAPAASEPAPTVADTNNTVTASITPSPPPQTDALIDIEGDDSAEKAMAGLFTLWGMPFSPGIAPCQQAAQLGLACMQGLGSLRDLERLDRPAVVRLSIAGVDHFLAIAHMGDGVVELVSGKGDYRLKEGDVTMAWDGKYAILWKPPPEYRIVQRGDKGATVDWLARQLAMVSGDESAPVVGATFDAPLEQRLKRFQITQGIKPDGIAGVMTWIHINSLLDQGVPRLQVRGG